MTDVARKISEAREIAECLLAPRAQAADQADSPPIESIRALASSGLLGLSMPARYGGIGASPADLREYTEILASACGLTTFVQGQHQSAALIIAGGENEDLKQELLPPMASGAVMCGVAFSHLRRQGDPILRAREESAGFVFDGVAPWLTGWGIMHEVVLGGTLPDERFLYVVAPLTQVETMQASSPMRLCAMNASGTVSLSFRGFRVPRNRYLKTITREQMAQNDVRAILVVTPQPFGVSRASISLLRRIGESRTDRAFARAADAMESDLNELRAEVEEWVPRSTESGFRERALDIRARAILHGVRCAHAALAASGGRGNGLEHPAQRLFREAMFYTLTAQTPDVQTATLALLSGENAID